MSILSLLILFLQLLSSSTTLALYYRLTAISTNQRKESTIECWQLCTPISISNQPGISGAALQALGPIANASLAFLPPNFDGGLHNAPFNQYVAFIAGEAVITLPCSSTTAVVKGGKYGLIFAADTAAVSKLGHYTKYPSKEQTVAITFPTGDGKIPNHKVLHNGQCTEAESDVCLTCSKDDMNKVLM